MASLQFWTSLDLLPAEDASTATSIYSKHLANFRGYLFFYPGTLGLLCATPTIAYLYILESTGLNDLKFDLFPRRSLENPLPASRMFLGTLLQNRACEY